jgi:hypothetical protein
MRGGTGPPRLTCAELGERSVRPEAPVHFRGRESEMVQTVATSVASVLLMLAASQAGAQTPTPLPGIPGLRGIGTGAIRKS